MESIDAKKMELRKRLSDALNGENPDDVAEVMLQISDAAKSETMAAFEQYKATQNAEVLARRGVRQLTAEEVKFYGAVAKAYDQNDIKAAFDGLDNAFPETVIDAVLEDIKSAYPLLGAINIQNTSTITKMIVNKQGVQLAAWGALGSKITKELDGAISKIEIGTNKLTAFMAVSKDMLDAGPAWIDAYVRAVLVEALGGALCKALVTGTGKDEPIGMMKDVSDDAAVQGGVYPDKAAVAVTDFTPTTLGTIANTIAKGPNGRRRVVPQLLMVVNPGDYFTKVMPATTFLTPNGAYVNNVLPYPTKIVQDENVPEGRAVFGLASRYFMGVGKGGVGGKIEYSDEFRFLDDERVYITKMYGNGMPLDNNAFVVADISGLTPVNLQVTVKQKA